MLDNYQAKNMRAKEFLILRGLNYEVDKKTRTGENMAELKEQLAIIEENIKQLK